MRTIVGLAIVIAVIWGLAWILRQVKAGARTRDASDRSGLASVAALTLGSGRSVHLVRAGNDYVLLGSTEHGVVPIHRYTEEEAREAGLLVETRARTLAPGERASQLVPAPGASAGQRRAAPQRLPDRAGGGSAVTTSALRDPMHSLALAADPCGCSRSAARAPA